MTREGRFQAMFGGQIAESDLGARTINGGMVAVLSQAAEFLLRIGSIMVLARLLMPEHFGLIGMVTAITAIAERFKDFGLGMAIVQHEKITHTQVSTLFWVNAGIGLVIMLLIAAFAYPISLFYGDPRLVYVTLAISTSFLWSGLIIQHQALLRRRMKFFHIAAIQLSATGLSIVVAVLLAMRGYGYWALVAREVIWNVLMAVGTWIAVPWVPGAPSRRANVREMLSFGGDLTAFNFVWFLAANLDQILIGKYAGAGPLGLYRQAFNLVATPISQINFPVTTVAEAALSRLQNDRDRYRKYYFQILSTLSMVTMPLVAFLAVFAEEVVLVVLGEAWSGATQIFRLLAVAVFIRPAALTVGFVMTTCGMSRRYFWWGVLASLSLVLFVGIGIRWGAIGIAYAHVAASYLVLVPLLCFGFRHTPISFSDFVCALWKPAVASLVMAGILWAGKQTVVLAEPLSALAYGVVAGFVGYFGFWLTLPAWRSELLQTIRSISSFFSPAA